MTGRIGRIAAAACLALVVALTGAAAPAGTEAAGKVAMEAAKKGKKKRKKRSGGKTMTFRSNLPAEIPDRGAGVTGYFGVLDSWIRIGRAMRGKRVADVDAGFSVSGPPDQLEDIGVYLRAPNGAFTYITRP